MRKVWIIAISTCILIFTGCSQEKQTMAIESQKSSENTLKSVPPVDSFIEETYSQLKEVVKGRKKQLIDYMELIQSKANSIYNDELMLSFFKSKKEFYYLTQEMESIPDDVIKKTKEVDDAITDHYLKNYLIFYDILLINNNGDVFYTIKKEKDFHKNIFSAKFENIALSEQMQKRPSESFVDFQFYDISGEPSAFFIEPVKNSDGLSGWFVFQFSINRINKMFRFDKKLGSTGEVILVNKDHYMLTDSRFTARSTILKQQLANENIETKFRERSGRKTVIDYRGFKVMSVFEVFPFLGSEWLIIAKINQSEVLTHYLREYRAQLDPVWIQALKNEDPVYGDYVPVTLDHIEVDMDEFKRTDSSQNLYTHGVSSCTTVVVSLPDHFSYLSHISPYDRIYEETKTDIFGHMIHRITFLEIPEVNKQNVGFVLVSQNTEVIEKIVDILLEEGYFLNQIKVLHNAKAAYANVLHLPKTNQTIVNWNMSREKKQFISQNSSDVKSLGKRFSTELSIE